MSSNHPFERHPFTPKSPYNYFPLSTSHWSAPDNIKTKKSSETKSVIISKVLFIYNLF